MSTIYRTKRKKIAEALATKLKEIDGSFKYRTNIFENVSS